MICPVDVIRQGPRRARRHTELSGAARLAPNFSSWLAADFDPCVLEHACVFQSCGIGYEAMKRGMVTSVFR